ncbi:MAG: lysylphosphatidylglycerol synthase transmembrane domain-containing protein [Acidobacteriota bacterium]
MRRAIGWAAGPVLAVLFLWLAFRGVTLAELGAALRRADVPLLVFAAATVVVHLLVRSLRWRTLLAETGQRVPFRELLSAVSIGYMASLLPGRVGEVLRPALLARRAAVPLGTALSTVAVERVVLDLMAVMFAGAIGFLAPARLSGIAASADPDQIALYRGIGLAILAGTLVALAAIHLVARRPEPLATRLAAWRISAAGRWRARVIGFVESLLPGIDGFRHPAGALRLLAETAAVWFVIAVGVHAGIVACGVRLAPLSAAVMLPILAFGVAFPTPGGTGTYHAAMRWGLTFFFAADDTDAVAAGLVVHAVTWLPLLAMGALFVALGGLVRPDADPARESA